MLFRFLSVLLSLTLCSSILFAERHVHGSSCPCRTSILKKQNATYEDVRVINGVSVPHHFPEFEVRHTGETAPGKIFTDFGAYLLILNNDGSPYYYHHYKSGRHDFQQQATGALSFVKGGCFDSDFFLMNERFEIFKTLRLGGKAMTGGHEVVALENGHVIYIELMYEDMDMSQVVSGGDPNAMIQVDNIIEVNGGGERVFEWRGGNHYNILDMGDEIDLTQMIIELGHINSMAMDYDDQLVVSNRHFCELTKINRSTGEVMWRLGGKNNSFTWINEDTPFAYQHCARPVPGKPDHYLLFDNGNGREVEYSRAVEYRLDLSAMTAEKVWEYRKSPDLYSRAQGSVQRLPNGNTLIGWGMSFSEAQNMLLTEVTPEGEVVYEISGQESSRCHRYDWSGRAEKPYLIAEPVYDHVTLIFNQFGATGIDHYKIYGNTEGNPPALLKTATQPWARLMPADLNENETYWYFRVTSVDSAGNESAYSNQEYKLVSFTDATGNMIFNGDFSKDDAAWELVATGEAAAGGLTDQGAYHLTVSHGGSFLDHVRLTQNNIRLIRGNTYRLTFDARADSRKTIETRIDDYLVETQRLTSNTQNFSYDFTMNDPDDFDCTLEFHCGLTAGQVYLDNVSLKNLSVSGVDEHAFGRPSELGVLQNYPNPFNPATVISYQLSVISTVRLDVFDVTGRVVSVLADGEQAAGMYQVAFDGSALTSGIYYYRLTARGDGREVVEVRKMALVK